MVPSDSGGTKLSHTSLLVSMTGVLGDSAWVISKKDCFPEAICQPHIALEQHAKVIVKNDEGLKVQRYKS
jgi:hypothetical protein